METDWSQSGGRGRCLSPEEARLREKNQGVAESVRRVDEMTMNLQFLAANRPTIRMGGRNHSMPGSRSTEDEGLEGKFIRRG